MEFLFTNFSGNRSNVFLLWLIFTMKTGIQVSCRRQNYLFLGWKHLFFLIQLFWQKLRTSFSLNMRFFHPKNETTCLCVRYESIYTIVEFLRLRLFSGISFQIATEIDDINKKDDNACCVLGCLIGILIYWQKIIISIELGIAFHPLYTANNQGFGLLLIWVYPPPHLPSMRKNPIMSPPFGWKPERFFPKGDLPGIPQLNVVYKPRLYPASLGILGVRGTSGYTSLEGWIPTAGC